MTSRRAGRVEYDKSPSFDELGCTDATIAMEPSENDTLQNGQGELRLCCHVVGGRDDEVVLIILYERRKQSHLAESRSRPRRKIARRGRSRFREIRSRSRRSPAGRTPEYPLIGRKARNRTNGRWHQNRPTFTQKLRLRMRTFDVS